MTRFDTSAHVVDELEKQLKLSLRPVQPSPEFVDHLHSRLTTPVTMSIERRSSMALGLLLVAFSLLSGALLVMLMRHFRTVPEEQGLANSGF